METSKIKNLAVAALKADAKAPIAYSYTTEDGKVENFSIETVNKAIRNEFSELTCDANGRFDYHKYQDNKNTIFSIIEQSIDEVLPARVEAQYMQFADVVTIPQGDRAVFRLRVTEASKRRAKTFVTHVGLAGRYETFMLDGKEMTVKTDAHGGAARIGFEEFLDGRWQFSDFTELLLEGLDEAIYKEVMKALENLVTSVPAANQATVAGFDEATMDEILAIVDVYGKASIYCTQEFANKMIPSDQRMSNEMKNALWNKGWLGDYKGHNVIILDQSIAWGEGEINSTKAIDPSRAYIIPTGSEKPVKVVFEGQTHVREVTDNDDWSTELQAYTKVGVGLVAALDGPIWIGVYENTELGLATRS